MPSRIVVAYSGALNSSIAIAWLKERHGGEVIAVTLDVGQGRELSQIRERAMAAGANRCHVLDVREDFIRDFVLPTLQADGLLQGQPLPIALSRPLIAQKLLQMAQMEGATAVAHGCAEGADQIRIETALRAIQPEIEVIAPVPASGMSRDELIEYARERRLPGLASFDGDELRQNLWGRTIRREGSNGEPAEVPESFYTRTKSPNQAPDVGAYVEIDWDKGVPVSINGVGMLLTELVDSLDLIAGGHGVGRFDRADNDGSGVETRVFGEAPAATVLHAAHRDLEHSVIPDNLQRLKRPLSKAYAGIIEDGSWFSPARRAIDAFARSIQNRVTGTVRIKLSRGICQVVERKPGSVLSERKADPALTSDGPVWKSEPDERAPSHTATE